jgi:hypothetical protein
MSAMLEELTLVIGHAATRRLVEVYGGRNIFPPMLGATGARWNQVREIVGEAAADALCRRYCGTRLYIPLNVAARRAWQEREIVRLSAEGLSDDEIADKIAVMIRPTASWVARVRRRATREAESAASTTVVMDL